MSQNSSSAPVGEQVGERKPFPIKRVLLVVGLPLWVFLGFMLAQAITLAITSVMQFAGFSFELINKSVLNATLSGFIYLLSVAIVIGVPWLVKKRQTTLKNVGLQRLPDWLDILWAPAGFIAYMILSSLLMWAAVQMLPFVDFEQVQDTGFGGISQRYEYFLAFISLVVVAPLSEEILFRGYLFQKLQKRAPLWLAIFITSLTFAIVHFAWNVGFDVFALSIVLCLLRVLTGSLWASILLHMIKNGVAFYFLFVSPTTLGILG